jgi:hypothetical protein
MLLRRTVLAICCFSLFLLAVAPTYGTPFQQSVTGRPSQQGATATLTIDPSQATTGQQVSVHGSSFLANEKVSLFWETVDGDVKVIGGYMYGGHQFQNRSIQMIETVADASGQLSSTIVVPYDYGGYHQILAEGSDGSAASFSFYVTPTLTMNPSTGPVGTKITFTGSGFGWTSGLDDAWQVNYDNKYLGYFMTIRDKGNVSFSIYASGEPGLHTIDAFANPYGPTYLNLQEAFPEFARLPRFEFDFHLTQGQPSAATSGIAWNVPPTQTAASTQGPVLRVDPSSGAVNTMTKVSGSSFRPGENVDLNWMSVVGAYISPSGFTNTSVVFSTVRADSAGQFEAQFKIPYDVGGTHIIQAKGSQGSNSNSTFYLARSAEVTPTTGPAGTRITIHIYGVGWRSWENIVAVDYDDAYTGYGCALGSQPGNITIFLTAIGQPGLHTIDLYPSIFRGPLTINYRSQGGVEPDTYRFPLLTPNELPGPLPIFHFEFIITGQTAPVASVNYFEYVVASAIVLTVVLIYSWRRVASRA